ncbi:MAG: O-antigen ligase family protein [Flavobacteriales bacterium]|nr:O-antigen ligase family protein [Flavobacteriales bacterium]
MRTPWLDRTEQFLIFVLAGFLFWPHAVSSIALILLVGLRLYRSGKETVPKGMDWLLFLPALVIFIAWGMHGAASNGQAELQLWATFLAAVLYFKTSPFRKTFVQSFALMSLIQAALVLGAIVFGEAATAGSFSQHVRDQIDQLFHVHPTYLSAVWLWAGTWLILEKGWPIRYRQASLAGLAIMAGITGGKMPFLAFAVVLVYIILSSVQRTRHRIIVSSILIVFMGINALLNPGLRDRFTELIGPTTEYSEGQWLTSTELRLGIWGCVKHVALEHWQMGVGTGNTRPPLEECFAGYDQAQFFETEFNSHNQYMHFWLVGGILGFLSILGYFAWLFYVAIQRRDKEFIAALIYLCLLLLTENYFSRQAGMMLFAFTLTALYFRPRVDAHSAASNPAK